ncbi:DnaJ domain-containing protein [Roseospirillum parvum]|uniref:DnaJ domain-containing protein n=1 Tax=Roseospirillum parvum TaxID=83401 RepID=A0A1G7WGN4_9PROT|nr:DnaJ domain-containing protein [Roseospirillum parvum]SDG71126.1 DnaJ domain-containing protein [Roseospirillum parvum]
MLPAFLLGVGLLIGLILLGRWARDAEPADLWRAVRMVAGVLLGVGILLLIVTGRLGWALAALLGYLPWLNRLAQLMSLRRGLGGLFGGGPRGFGNAGAGRTSQVETAWLALSLDLESGEMTGTVRAGPFAGRSLDSLSRQEIGALARALTEDADSRRLLATWLTRNRPDWADDVGSEAGSGEGEGAAADGPMSRAEALDILGLDDGASDDAIRAAHRRLIAQVHPDKGGSAWLAAKLNQAREVLLGTGRG